MNYESTSFDELLQNMSNQIMQSRRHAKERNTSQPVGELRANFKVFSLTNNMANVSSQVVNGNSYWSEMIICLLKPYISGIA